MVISTRDSSRSRLRRSIASLAAGPDAEITAPQQSFKIIRVDYDAAGPSVGLEFESDPGQTYQVQYSADLRTWLPADGGDLTASSATTTYQDTSITTAIPVRYHRVVPDQSAASQPEPWPVAEGAVPGVAARPPIRPWASARPQRRISRNSAGDTHQQN